MTVCWIFIRNVRHQGLFPSGISRAGRPRSPESMFPRFYDVAYHEDGTIASMVPNNPHVPGMIVKAARGGYDRCIISGKAAVFPILKATQDRVVLEIQRGCIRGCRFCQAGMVYRPVERTEVWRSLKDYADTYAEKYRT